MPEQPAENSPEAAKITAQRVMAYIQKYPRRTVWCVHVSPQFKKELSQANPQGIPVFENPKLAKNTLVIVELTDKTLIPVTEEDLNASLQAAPEKTLDDVIAVLKQSLNKAEQATDPVVKSEGRAMKYELKDVQDPAARQLIGSLQNTHLMMAATFLFTVGVLMYTIWTLRQVAQERSPDVPAATATEKIAIENPAPVEPDTNLPPDVQP